MKRLIDYRGIVGNEILSEIYQKARKLYDKHIIHINSTYMGGGVAEILNSLIPLMNDIGIDTGWRILHGNSDLFNITKKFHNALQGDSINLTPIKKKLYELASEDFSTFTHLDHDVVIIHDPQPLPLIEFHRKQQPWLWRCHVDLSHPDKKLWDYLTGYLLMYDLMIVSNEKYKKADLPLPQKIIAPVIDPLTPKNKDLSESDINKYLKKYSVPTDKPLLTQISRFDKWKDPLGVVEVFKLVKEVIDCRLVLCGSMATDDPEGIKIYMKVKQRANHMVENRDIILITSENNILVNALQRKSAVIIQKSLKEGFGLTVTEALWKEKAVVASNVGGIPLQITNGENGFLFEPTAKQAFASKIIELIQNPEMAKEMGKVAKESVRQKFLITRLVKDYLCILEEVA